MCRYAFKSYKTHFACFHCRKAFKQARTDDILLRIKKDKVYHELNGKSIRKVNQVFTKAERKKLAELQDEIKNRPIKCPECGNLMANLGLDFKAPKKTAVKEWKIIEGLVKIGRMFLSCGCEGIGYIPQKPLEYESYLRRVQKQYEKYLKRSQEDNEGRYDREQINYWLNRIENVKKELVFQKFDTTMR